MQHRLVWNSSLKCVHNSQFESDMLIRCYEQTSFTSRRMIFLQNFLAADRWAFKLGLTSTVNILNALRARTHTHTHTHTHTQRQWWTRVCVCVVATESWEAVIMLLVSVRRSRGSCHRCCCCWEREREREREQSSLWKHPSIPLRCCHYDSLQLSCQRCKKQTGGGLESCLNGC